MWFGSALHHVEATAACLESQAPCLFNLQQVGLVSGAFLGSRRQEVSREPESKNRGILAVKREGGKSQEHPMGQRVPCLWTSGALCRSREDRHLRSVWSFSPEWRAGIPDCGGGWVSNLGTIASSRMGVLPFEDMSLPKPQA